MDNQTYYLCLDLKDDEQAIQRYEEHHRHVWPEIIQSISESGIVSMEIYRAGNRLFMIMVTNPDFSFDKKSAADRGNPKVQEWETLMDQFQQRLPFARAGDKWVLMNRIFAF